MYTLKYTKCIHSAMQSVAQAQLYLTYSIRDIYRIVVCPICGEFVTMNMLF